MKREEVNYNELSPMMQQYMDIKSNYKNELVFFRLGDFYELFFEDAYIASRELELTLTGKNAGLKERIPMCGVPFHSVKPYIEKLVNKNYKIAIVEQLEDPKSTKGMVKRGVVAVVSKGTLVDLEYLNETDYNYIGAIIDYKHSYVICYADISTGDIYVETIPYIKEKLLNEILYLNLKEIIIPTEFNIELISTIENIYNINVTYDDEYLDSEYKYIYENIIDLKEKETIKLLLHYLVIKQLKDISHFSKCKKIDRNNYLQMDVHTIRNLELTETIRNNDRLNSLIWLIDKTKTAMGSRMLKNWLLNPLKDKDLIEDRYDKIETLNNEFLIKEELKRNLYEIYDIERLICKVNCGSLNARDLIQIKNSLKVLPNIKQNISDLKFEYSFNDLKNIYDLIDNTIIDDPPLTIREGRMIKQGYNSELDELRSIRSGGKDFISRMETSERERTGLKTLKVGYNKIFGYFIEISKSQVKELDPSWNFERRQTLTDKERFITPELKEKEALILNAEEKIIELEYNIFNDIKNNIKSYLKELKIISNVVSELDSLSSLSTVSEEYSFIRPILNTDNDLKIIDGRHPVVEMVLKNGYVQNSCIMDKNTCTLLITGPNMSGKSTYMRQLAIIVILAQMGSFVPAKEANLPIFDKIFTRIGASDDLVSGESTFMVEMIEAKNAIINATKDSLILFDELGRGTATYDGMSIAEAILEYINRNIKCKTLFSTHYHELTDLSKNFSSIKNIHVSALEKDGNIVFLHKIKDGAVDKSYGIHVAKLAGMPDELIDSANRTLACYENKPRKEKQILTEQITFDLKQNEPDLLRERLNKIDPLSLTPMEAINVLYELKTLDK